MHTSNRGGHNRSQCLRSYGRWVTSDQGGLAVRRGIDAAARAARALREVVAAIDAGEVPDAGALRNYLVGVVVALDMLNAEQTQKGAP